MAGSISAATFDSRGHYGFVTVKADEAPGTRTFTARLEAAAGTAAVQRVYAHPVADGWQVYVSGWPAGVPGWSDLVLQAHGADGSVDLLMPRAVHATGGRMDVALVIDDSFSMRKTDPLRLRVKALTLFARIAAERGVVKTLSVIVFNRRPRLTLPPTPPTDSASFEHAMTDLVAEGSTDLDGALIMAMKTLNTLPDSRKVVIVLSDGKDEPGRYEDAHLRLTPLRIPVYTVGLSKWADQKTLSRVAHETGGTFMFAPDMTRLETIFQEIVLALHAPVTIGTWDLTAAAAVVPVDESVRLLTLKLEPTMPGAATATPPDGTSDPLVLRTAPVSAALCERYLPSRGLWQSSGAGLLTATAESNLELILFPPMGVATDAVPCAVAALLLRDGEAVTNDCTLMLSTAASEAFAQPLALTEQGYFSGVAVPREAGEAEWLVTAQGVTAAGYPFQRVATQRQRVVALRRDTLWMQPAPLRMELTPGCTVTGCVAIAGRGRFTAELQGFDKKLATLLDCDGIIPEGRTRDLSVAITADADARPGVTTGRVVVAVGRNLQAIALVEVSIQAPPISIGPKRLAWQGVKLGQTVTGTVWAVVEAKDRACRVHAVVQGTGTRGASLRDVILGTETTHWSVVVGPIDSETPLTGQVTVSWGWDTVEVPWQVEMAAVVAPIAVAVPEPPLEPEPEPAPEPEIEPVAAPVLPPEAPPVVTPPPEPPAVEAEPAVLPAAAVRSGIQPWRLALTALLIALLLYLLWRMAHGDPNRLIKYYAASIALHLLAFVLTLDVLLQTEVVTLEQLSPTLAVTLNAVEQRLGLLSTPLAGAIAVKDSPAAAQNLEKADHSLPTPEAPPAAQIEQQLQDAADVDALQPPMSDPLPEPLTHTEAETARESVAPDVLAAEESDVAAKRQETAEPVDSERSLDAARSQDAPAPAVARQIMDVAVPADTTVAAVSVEAELENRRAPDPLTHTEAKTSRTLVSPDVPAAEDRAIAAKRQDATASADSERTLDAARGQDTPAPAAVRQAMSVALSSDTTVAEVSVKATRVDHRATDALPGPLTHAKEKTSRALVSPDAPTEKIGQMVAKHVTKAADTHAAGEAVETGDASLSERPPSAMRLPPGVGNRPTAKAGTQAESVSEPGATPVAMVTAGTSPHAAAVKNVPIEQQRQIFGPEPTTLPQSAAEGEATRQAGQVTPKVALPASEIRGATQVAVARGTPIDPDAANTVGLPSRRAGVAAPGLNMRAPDAAKTPLHSGGATRAPTALPRVAAEGTRTMQGPTLEKNTAETAAITIAAARRQSDGPGEALDGPRAARVTRAETDAGDASVLGTRSAPAAAAAPAAARPETARDTILEVAASAIQPEARRDTTTGDLSLKGTAGGASTVQATLALAQYGGDWDCARTAMMFLSHQLRERTGMALMASDAVVKLDHRDLQRLPFVYMTGHTDFHFTEAEVINLREYLRKGGHLWIDDSTDYRDETYDKAFRREIARVLPDATIERLGADFGAWNTGYDLTRGYKGYAIPPGDKYRQDYIEGISINGRVAVVYTRNDYGDGLTIDSHTQPLKDSLTSLGPAEMQEGATRMGVNLILFFLSQRGKIDLAFMDNAAGDMRRAADPTDVKVPQGVIRALSGAADALTWFREDWGDAAAVTQADKDHLAINFQVGAQKKAALGRMFEPALSLQVSDTLAVDVESLLSCGARVALGLDTSSGYFETAPFYIKPGRNAAFFVCAAHTFKSAATAWEFRAALPMPCDVTKVNLLIYSPDGGEMRITNFRIIR